MNKKLYGLILKKILGVDELDELQEAGMAGAGVMGPAKSMMGNKPKMKKEKKKPIGTYGTSWKVGTNYAAGIKGESKMSDVEKNVEPEGEVENTDDIFEAIRSKHPGLKHVSAKKRSETVKKARAGEKVGHGEFKKVEAKAAKRYGSEESGKRVAASAMWKMKKLRKGKK